MSQRILKPGEQSVDFGKGFRIKPYEPGDEHEILPLFSRVFPRPRSIDEWRWIYRDSPAGAHVMLGWAPDGGLAAQYAGVRYKAVLNGKEVFVGNVRDIFTAPQYRSVRKGQYLLVSGTAQAFFDMWTGPGKLPFCFGFPHERHSRLGKLTMAYTPFSNWGRYRFLIDNDASRSSRLPARGKIERLSAFDSRFDRLWESRKNKFRFAVSRDSSFLTWRFLKNPSRSYLIWSYSPFLSAEITGYAVILAENEQAWLMDFCLPEPFQACRWFWRQVTDALLWRGARVINIWLALSTADLNTLLSLGFEKLNIEGRMVPVYRCFDPALDSDWCGDNFYFNMADSDLL